jgi:superfamily II DNA or RNA helicase
MVTNNNCHLPLFDDQLRDYQREAILKARASFRAGNKKVMVVLPTGTGKTRMFTILPKDGARILVVCPQRELVGQTVGTIRSLRRMAAGVEMAGSAWDGEPWAVACYASLVSNERYKKFLGNIDLVVVDECDTSFSIPFRSMMEEFVAHGARVLGVTATPFRGDKASLFGFYEDVPFCMELREALSQFWLASPEVFVHRIKSVDFSKLAKAKSIDYSPEQLDRLLTSEQVSHDIASLAMEVMVDSHNVLFCNSVLQSRIMRDLMVTRHGVKTSLVWGTQNPEERAAEIKAFEDGTNKLIVNCNVLGRGYDCPEIRSVINAKPTKSKARYIQCLGRGTRTLPGVLKPGMTLEERGAAIAASAKPKWFMHDITSTVRFHEPITAIDILLQGSKEIIQKVKEKNEDKPVTPEELDEALAEAIAEQEALEKLAREEEKRRRAGLIVGVTFDSQSRDLFAKADAKSPKVRCYRFLYGRYKGMPLTSPDVPDSYLSWCIEKGRMTPFWMQVYKQELDRRETKKLLSN